MKTFLIVFGLWVFAGAVFAQPVPAVFDEPSVRAFAQQQVAAQGGVARFDVQVTPPDLSRYALAPCRRTEPFLPAGARLWGRSSIGLRCVDGASWTVMVPVTVTAWGPALVAAQPLAAGSVPMPQDVREQEVELTRENGALLKTANELQGRTLTRALQPGQVLRTDMLRATPVLQAGEPVRLRIVGVGYAITATGQALNAAAEGQPARVRTEMGRVLTGIAREGRQVDVTP